MKVYMIVVRILQKQKLVNKGDLLCRIRIQEYHCIGNDFKTLISS